MTIRNAILSILIILISGTFASCNFLFGKKDDPTVDEIFDEGAIDPNLVPSQVGYVPILPVWSGFQNPVDVFVGYDQMVYVVDDNGVNVLDLKGERQRIIPIPGAVEVTQDRRLHTYVAGKATVKIDGTDRELAAVYHIVNAAGAGGYSIIDTLIHPFMDKSRNNIAFRLEDLQVEITGLATRADNVLYVARRGPVYNPSSTARPDNAVLFFSPDGEDIGYAVGLNPNNSSLKSILGVSSIATFATPPQRLTGVNETHDFLIAQAAQNVPVEFRVLWIKENFSPDAGIRYEENPALLNRPDENPNNILYKPYRFQNPQDVFIATDATGYIFVVDAELDSLYQFTRQGFEGVNPPPSSGISGQAIVSFGGQGSGPFQFMDPTGVCYYEETVYVADRGNNRIMRYRLNTDLE